MEDKFPGKNVEFLKSSLMRIEYLRLYTKGNGNSWELSKLGISKFIPIWGSRIDYSQDGMVCKII